MDELQRLQDEVRTLQNKVDDLEYIVKRLTDFKEKVEGKLLCKCGSPSTEIAPCPFNDAIYDDKTPCNCCNYCRSGCGDRI